MRDYQQEKTKTKEMVVTKHDRSMELFLLYNSLLSKDL